MLRLFMLILLIVALFRLSSMAVGGTTAAAPQQAGSVLGKVFDELSAGYLMSELRTDPALRGFQEQTCP